MSVVFVPIDKNNPLTLYRIVITLTASAPDEELQTLIKECITLLKQSDPDNIKRDYSFFHDLLQAMIPNEDTYKALVRKEEVCQ